MKKGIFLIALLTATNVFAGPNDHHYSFVCPATSGDSDVITHFGTYIGGYGDEFMNGSHISDAYFKGPVFEESNIPHNISMGGYFSSGTSYASATGVVSCMYTSKMGYDPFKVSYQMTNGLGGVVTSSNDGTITIRLIQGAKS